MKLAILAFSLCVSSSAMAYNYFPLSPSWFKTVYQNLAEDKKEVWRGTVEQTLSPTSILVKNINGTTTEVELLHLTPKKNASDSALRISLAALEDLTGKQIYVLGKQNKKRIAAKIIDASGQDINLDFVSKGYHDINTTSLMNKREKTQYLNAYYIAKKSRSGIWF